jgi:hypothetical protein
MVRESGIAVAWDFGMVRQNGDADQVNSRD